ncbi:MAG: hypothetical protein QXJ51_03620 [Sulfolobales archaeon]
MTEILQKTYSDSRESVRISKPLLLLYRLGMYGEREFTLDDLIRFIGKDPEDFERELILLIESGLLESTSLNPLKIRVSMKGRKIVNIIRMLQVGR